MRNFLALFKSKLNFPRNSRSFCHWYDVEVNKISSKYDPNNEPIENLPQTSNNIRATNYKQEGGPTGSHHVATVPIPGHSNYRQVSATFTKSSKEINGKTPIFVAPTLLNGQPGTQLAFLEDGKVINVNHLKRDERKTQAYLKNVNDTAKAELEKQEKQFAHPTSKTDKDNNLSSE